MCITYVYFSTPVSLSYVRKERNHKIHPGSSIFKPLSRAELFFLLDGLLEVDDLDGPFAGGLVPHDLVERSVVPGVDEPHEGDVARLLAPLLLLRLGRRPELLLQAVPNSPEIISVKYEKDI